MAYTETSTYNPEVKIEDIKEEITEMGHKSSSPNCEQYFPNPNMLRHDLSNESYISRISSLKRKQTDMNTENIRGEQLPATAQKYQPYRSVIQKMIKHPDNQIS